MSRELVLWVIGAVVVILAVREWRETDFVGKTYLAVLLFVAGLFASALLTRC